MGIQIQTPMGATGGAGAFTAIDNGLELDLIAGELSLLVAALGTMNTANQTMLQTMWGTPSLAVPGSPGASLANISILLANISDTLIDIQSVQESLVAATNELSSATKQQALSTQRLETLQSTAVADQLETNRFQKAETVAALQRNGIDPQPVPPILETLKEKLIQGTQLNLSTEFQTSVRNTTDKMLIQLKDYIVSSSVVTWGQAQLTSFWGYIGLNKLTAAAADTPKALANAAKKTSSATARTGVWVPPVIPPNP